MDGLIFERCGSVYVVFTSRVGGVSLAPYDSLNVGVHVGDDLVDVQKNRELIFQELNQFGLPKNDEWIFLNQTHCDSIYEVDSESYDQQNPPTADASITKEGTLPLVAMIADCGPLVLSCGEVLAVIHASAKTVASNLIEKTIQKIRKLDSNSELFALLGPCIHKENYEYKIEDLNVLAGELGEHVKAVTTGSKPAFDLPSAIKFECEKFGASFRDLDIDTFTNENYFSYRRDRTTGRQCVIAWK